MPNVLERIEVKYLHEWSAQSPLKPIVIRGARQVGKSTLVREFARTAHFSLVELNFERNPEFREAFTFRGPDPLHPHPADRTDRRRRDQPAVPDSHGSLKGRIQTVFDRLPGMVGRKFKYVQVSRDHRAAELADALRHLCMARVASKIHHTSANGVPLAAEADERRFKCLYMDVGLMCAALHLDILHLGRQDLTLANGGAVAEQFVGQHLLYSGPRYETPTLYYWTREARNAAAEVDYLIAPARWVVPVEIKAGTTGSLRSVHQFLKEKRRDFALRFNADVPSLLRDSKGLSGGTRIDYHLLSLPLYMVCQARRLVVEFESG